MHEVWIIQRLDIFHGLAKAVSHGSEIQTRARPLLFRQLSMLVKRQKVPVDLRVLRPHTCPKFSEIYVLPSVYLLRFGRRAAVSSTGWRIGGYATYNPVF